MAKSNLTAAEVVLADETKRAALEHLRVRQSELWTKAASVLGFDGLLIAASLVLITGERIEILPDSWPETAAFFGSLVFLLASSGFAVLSINQNGKYPEGKDADYYIGVFASVMDRSARYYKMCSLACWVGTLAFTFTLFSCLLTSGLFLLHIG